MQRTTALRVGLAAAVVVVLAVLAWMSWPAAEPDAYHPARATVVAPVNCGSSGSGEIVRLGPEGPGGRRAVLNSCGHEAGEVLNVRVRAGPEGPTVWLAGTGVTESAVTQGRVAAILLVVAAAAGAILAWRLYRATTPSGPSPRAPRRGGGRHHLVT